jgi:hypothetical protein
VSKVIKDPITAKFIQLMDEATRDFSSAKQQPDRALFFLLKRYANELPDVREKETFHKWFRQIDVTDSGEVDMAIWHLIDCSKVVWECLDACKPTRATKKVPK